MDEKDALRSSVEPLSEAAEIINKLLEFCATHGLKREAYSIALGEEIPEPPKRPRHRPKEKGSEFYRALAVGLAVHSDGRPMARGAKAKFARWIVAQEAAERKGARQTKKAETGRISSLQNELSRIRPETLLSATYVVRRREAGDSFEAIKSTLEGAVAGDSDLARKVANVVRDVLSALDPHRKSRN
jgi:hypothetical protein